VKQLGAETVTRPQRAEFTAFNGQPMITSEEITLFFKNSKGGSLFWAVFLVADVEAVPFDMVLGGSDCLGFNIIPKPSFPCLGLVPRKLTPGTQSLIMTSSVYLLIVDRRGKGTKRETDRTCSRGWEKPHSSEKDGGAKETSGRGKSEGIITR